MIGVEEAARTATFVSGIPAAAGAIIFVADRKMADFVRDLVIMHHGIRGSEATSIFVAPTREDEVPLLLEQRRTVYRHPALMEARGEGERCVPRRAPEPASATAVSPAAPGTTVFRGTLVDTKPPIGARGATGAIGISDRALNDARVPSSPPHVVGVLGMAPVKPTSALPGTTGAPGRPPGDYTGIGAAWVVSPKADEPEGEVVLATVRILRDPRSARPYLIHAPSVRRGAFMEVHDTLDAAIAALPAVARRVVGASAPVKADASTLPGSPPGHGAIVRILGTPVDTAHATPPYPDTLIGPAGPAVGAARPARAPTPGLANASDVSISFDADRDVPFRVRATSQRAEVVRHYATADDVRRALPRIVSELAGMNAVLDETVGIAA